jgi:putative FmdB family regulatory protein
MPIYEYRCADCGKTCEVLVLSGNSVARCPACGSSKLERLFSASCAINVKENTRATCCGRTERCETPPCAADDACIREGR